LGDPNPAAVDTAIAVSANVDDTSTGNSNIADAEYSLNGGETYQPMDAITAPARDVDVSAAVAGIAEATLLQVCFRATDDAGNVGETACFFLPVYDPQAGFVTGGGWIESPAGAYALDGDWSGKAYFGFVSKYKKDATVPTGQTEFVLEVDAMAFHSDAYEWLVVEGAKATYTGTGSINGQGGYTFVLSAVDGDFEEKGAAPDTFRVKIAEEIDGVEYLIYDSNLGGEVDAVPVSTVQGSVVLHVPKK